MKEFSVKFQKGLQTGLRTSEQNPRNEQALVTCYNLKPTKMGLRPYEPLTNPLTGVSTDWPFPQLFIGQQVRILATATNLYELSTWTLGSAKATVTETDRWDFVDFGPYLILTNGLKLCIRAYGGTWSTNDYLATMPRFGTVCNYNGQLVAGNIKTTWHGCGTGSIVWSRIGSVDFTPGGENEAGFRNMPWEGTVLRVMKLGKGVVVYCQNGIMLMTPWEEKWAFVPLSDVGILGKAAVGGNERTHVFVDKDYNLCRIGQDFKIEVMDYREYMGLMTASDVIVEHDPVLREFHISNDSYGFVLTEAGLARVYQEVTTVATTQGVSYGVFDPESDVGAAILTDTLDFGLRGIKTIGLVEVSGAHTSGTLNAYSQWRNAKTGSFSSSPNVIVNPEGVATIMTSGDEFRVGLNWSAYAGVQCDYINMRIKLSDKRYVRGVYNVT